MTGSSAKVRGPMPDDRPEPADRGERDWLEPYDGDSAWERDRVAHSAEEPEYGEGWRQ